MITTSRGSRAFAALAGALRKPAPHKTPAPAVPAAQTKFRRKTRGQMARGSSSPPLKLRRHEQNRQRLFTRLGARDCLARFRRGRLAEPRIHRCKRIRGSHALAHGGGEIEARLHALGRGPCIAPIRKAVRTARLPKWHPEQVETLKIEVRIFGLKACHARRRENKLEGSADLRWFCAPGSIIRNQRRGDDGKIAVAVDEFAR